MAYNESLAERTDELAKGKKARPPAHTGADGNDAVGQGFTQKEMFGGIAHLFNGNMCVGVNKDDLIIRCDVELTNNKHIRLFGITGRPVKGKALVNRQGVKGTALRIRVDLSLNFAKSLPPKK